MRIFITGASGFVGGAVVKRLCDRYPFKAMARSAKSAQVVTALGAEAEHCSLSDVEAHHLADCDVVIHSAATVSQWGPYQDFVQGNVEGTRRLLAAARAAGVTRFIHISTEAVLFYGQDMKDIDEVYPYPKKTPFYYSQTKGEAERLVVAANDETFQTLILRPRLVWGPDDQTILPEVLKMIAENRFMWVGGGQALTSTTHIANLVAAVELALTRGDGGDIYFITDGETPTVREFMTDLTGTQGVTPPDKSVPAPLARGAARILEGIWRLFNLKGEPPLTLFAAAIISSTCTLRIDKARQALGYQPVMSIAEGMAELRHRAAQDTA